MTEEMVAWMEEAKASHDSWAHWLEAHPEGGAVADPRPRNESLGDARTHREWSDRYERVIVALKAFDHKQRVAEAAEAVMTDHGETLRRLAQS